MHTAESLKRTAAALARQLVTEARALQTEAAAKRAVFIDQPTRYAEWARTQAAAAAEGRRTAFESGHAVIRAHREAHVLTVPPDYSAKVNAAWAGLVPHLGPGELIAEGQEAVARGDLAKVAYLRKYDHSVFGYRRPFQTAEMLAHLAQLDAVRGPEEIASEETASLCDQLDMELGLLENILAKPRALETLDVYLAPKVGDNVQTLDVFPHLLPAGSVQPSGAAVEPAASARIEL